MAHSFGTTRSHCWRLGTYPLQSSISIAADSGVSDVSE